MAVSLLAKDLGRQVASGGIQDGCQDHDKWAGQHHQSEDEEEPQDTNEELEEGARTGTHPTRMGCHELLHELKGKAFQEQGPGTAQWRSAR